MKNLPSIRWIWAALLLLVAGSAAVAATALQGSDAATPDTLGKLSEQRAIGLRAAAGSTVSTQTTVTTADTQATTPTTPTSPSTPQSRAAQAARSGTRQATPVKPSGTKTTHPPAVTRTPVPTRTSGASSGGGTSTSSSDDDGDSSGRRSGRNSGSGGGGSDGDDADKPDDD